MVLFHPPDDDEGEYELYRPMSAKTYIEYVYPCLYRGISDIEWIVYIMEETVQSVRVSYEVLQDVPLIDAATLAEDYPREINHRGTKWGRGGGYEVDPIRLDEEAIPGLCQMPLGTLLHFSRLRRAEPTKQVHPVQKRTQSSSAPSSNVWQPGYQLLIVLNTIP